MSAKRIDRRRVIARRTCALIVVTALLVAVGGQAAGAEETYNAHPKPPTDGRVGSNYTPAYAVNQVQFWHDFRPGVVEKELAAAQKHFGITTLRVYLHNINFDEEKSVFLGNLEKFLSICENHGIKPGFVFFDDCHRADGIYLDKPTMPVKGYHNGRWAQCPQHRDRDPEDLEKFKPYVQEVIRAHRTDRRVLFWEIFNEPARGAEYSDKLKRAGYKWAKEVGPRQPVLNCHFDGGWGDVDVSDIVDSHFYNNAYRVWDRYAEANPGKGTVFTEAGARWKASRRNFGDPCEIIHWLEQRRKAGKSTPGVYLCWELMVGNSNCRWQWTDKPGAPEPEVPWCGLLWPDATPVSLAEVEAISRYTTGKSRALFFENFQGGADAWKAYGEKPPEVKNAIMLEPGTKAVAGDEKWTDYIFEGRVAIKPAKGAETGNAGLIFRVNEPGDRPEEMRGYYVGFDSKSLILGKLENDWRQLAAFDLAKLECKVRLNEWSQIRIAVTGPRIRIWLNRMHPSADPDRGLRIDYTDKNGPILSGAIGVRAHGAPAWFDNITVLPADALSDAPTAGAPHSR